LHYWAEDIVTALLIPLIVGAMVGWLAGQLVQGTGFGLRNDILVGIAGAFMAILLLPYLELDLGADILSVIIEATLGAVFLLVIVRLIRQVVA
jgi:uncharacterized membrane protein YeaQ/YmgE (transglycosylase-associated protein family)